MLVTTRTRFRIGLTVSFGALLAALTSGCATTSGGQTGEEAGGCWSKKTPLALDAQSPLGFSAQDSLSFSAGTHTAVLHWVPPTSYPYGPESGDSEVSVTVTSLGTAYFATQDSSSQAVDELLCSPAVLTDVNVTFDTAGGAFHESFHGMLAAVNKDAATLSATLLGGHVAGSFAFDPAALAGQSLAQITLNLSFSAGSFSGAVDAGIQSAHGSGASSVVALENVPLACWGSAPAPGQAGCAE